MSALAGDNAAGFCPVLPEAARRIADALRAFKVEGWFGQSELSGGDAWELCRRD